MTMGAILPPARRGGWRLKRHWCDGTSAVSFDPLNFIERLAALVPSPRAHQPTYHGLHPRAHANSSGLA
jgi:hypothetical protein